MPDKAQNIIVSNCEGSLEQNDDHEVSGQAV